MLVLELSLSALLVTAGAALLRQLLCAGVEHRRRVRKRTGGRSEAEVLQNVLEYVDTQFCSADVRNGEGVSRPSVDDIRAVCDGACNEQMVQMLYRLALCHIDHSTGTLAPPRSSQGRLWGSSSAIASLHRAVSASDAGTAPSLARLRPSPSDTIPSSPASSHTDSWPAKARAARALASTHAPSAISSAAGSSGRPPAATCHGRLERPTCVPAAPPGGAPPPQAMRKTCSCGSLLSTYPAVPASLSSRSQASTAPSRQAAAAPAAAPTAADDMPPPFAITEHVQPCGTCGSVPDGAPVYAAAAPPLPPQTSLLTLAEASQRACTDAGVVRSSTDAPEAQAAGTIGGEVAEPERNVFTRLPGLPAALQAEALASGFHRPSCIRAGSTAAPQHRSQRSRVAAPDVRDAHTRLEQMMGRADLGRG